VKKKKLQMHEFPHEEDCDSHAEFSDLNDAVSEILKCRQIDPDDPISK
jgi:hypothetical protein